GARPVGADPAFDHPVGGAARAAARPGLFVRLLDVGVGLPRVPAEALGGLGEGEELRAGEAVGGVVVGARGREYLDRDRGEVVTGDWREPAIAGGAAEGPFGPGEVGDEVQVEGVAEEGEGK